MFELAYISAARRLFSPDQLEKLLATARHNNARLGVSGILLYEDGSFMQVLEGDEPVVRELFATISEDPRHDRVQVLGERTIPQRSFAAWSMGFVSLDPKLVPRRHSLSSNGTLAERAPDLVQLLDAFRRGEYRAAILG